MVLVTMAAASCTSTTTETTTTDSTTDTCLVDSTATPVVDTASHK